MKNLCISASIMTFMCGAPVAYADNSSVESAIKNRPDLSSFYQALVSTGVNHELQEGQSYTVFAPTNEAFARTLQDQYPCINKTECNVQVAAIIRNHIIPGVFYIDDPAKQRGGFFSISHRFVTVGQPSRNDYAVAGKNVLYMSKFHGGMLYKIDGVIANPLELAALQYPEYAKKVTTVTKQTIPDPACGANGCPDSVTKTTTVTRTIVTPADLAPGR